MNRLVIVSVLLIFLITQNALIAGEIELYEVQVKLYPRVEKSFTLLVDDEKRGKVPQILKLSEGKHSFTLEWYEEYKRVHKTYDVNITDSKTLIYLPAFMEKESSWFAKYGIWFIAGAGIGAIIFFTTFNAGFG
jgi:hypothetical protein